jgi:hypothetical protein
MNSEFVLLLPNTDSFQQFGDFCKSLFYQIRTAFNNLKILSEVFGRSKTSSDKNLQFVESGQYLGEVEQALTKIFKLLKAVSI